MEERDQPRRQPDVESVWERRPDRATAASTPGRAVYTTTNESRPPATRQRQRSKSESKPLQEQPAAAGVHHHAKHARSKSVSHHQRLDSLPGEMPYADSRSESVVVSHLDQRAGGRSVALNASSPNETSVRRTLDAASRQLHPPQSAIAPVRLPRHHEMRAPLLDLPQADVYEEEWDFDNYSVSDIMSTFDWTAEERKSRLFRLSRMSRMSGVSRRISNYYGEIIDNYDYYDDAAVAHLQDPFQPPQSVHDHAKPKTRSFETLASETISWDRENPSHADNTTDDRSFSSKQAVSEHDSAERICALCQTAIDSGPSVLLLGRYWHKQHSECRECQRPIGVDNFAEIDGFLYCEDHYVHINGIPVAKTQAFVSKHIDRLEHDQLQKELANIAESHTVRKVRNLFKLEHKKRMNVLSIIEDQLGAESGSRRQKYIMSWLQQPKEDDPSLLHVSLSRPARK
ncbi:hypothetical protein HDV03_003365 [Kappamyces sp. JEL0829]|nr:hypothetical protein HDV03_003365 [Kappamyces sp. JEL0829]